MYLLGYDIGSSSVKASLIEAEKGTCIASAFSPKKEMEIIAQRPGWAEQHPDMWWENLKTATAEILASARIKSDEIKAIGLSYQMHGLVCVDKHFRVLRPAIIWCDSRAVPYGEKAFREVGSEKCLTHLLNSPGNFTLSKLAWVKENEPDIYKQIYKIMLPGDYIALRLTGTLHTTATGLSEGIMWDFTENSPALWLLNYFGIDPSLLPAVTPVFSIQGTVTPAAAGELGLREGIPVSYRAGDQPNNAFSLNVLHPGEIAATAGTSGVVYGITDQTKYDPESRVNTFVHVNHSAGQPRLGVLLCVNGTGILNSWLKHHVSREDYPQMNQLAESVPIGSNDLFFLPFGNGAERVLKNKNIGAHLTGLNFNIHQQAHVLRAAQEGIVFTLRYGIDIMKNTGIQPQVIRAGHANMFLSPIFREALACTTGAVIELYDTDGAQGAAKGAGVGAGIYSSPNEAFRTLKKIQTITPDSNRTTVYLEAYEKWKNALDKFLSFI